MLTSNSKKSFSTKLVLKLHATTLSLIACLCILTLVSHFPGQASVDTIIQLQDGMSGVYDSNQPPSMSWLMTKLTLPGVLVLNVILFGLAVVVLLNQLRASVWIHNVATLLLFCFPVIFIYNGIVWKDVLFANAALLGLLLLPNHSERLHFSSLIVSAIVLALAVSVRQQGVLAAILAFAYLLFAPDIFIVRIDRVKALAVWLAAYLCLASLIEIAVTTHGDTSGSLSVEGPLYQLATFDLGGISSQNPEIRFPALEAIALSVPEAHRPKRERIMSAFSSYSPDRHDYMGESIAASGVWFPKEALREDWRTRIIEYPLDYVEHRIKFLSWLFGFQNIFLCSPTYFGISAAPPEMVEEIGIEPGISWRAQLLGDFSVGAISLFRPYFYLGISIIVISVLIRQGWRHYTNMMVIQLAGLSYAASYAFVGIACDFRYTYFSTIASLFGLASVAIRATRDARSSPNKSMSALE